jgi:hypothetical protein
MVLNLSVWAKESSPEPSTNFCFDPDPKAAKNNAELQEKPAGRNPDQAGGDAGRAV